MSDLRRVDSDRRVKPVDSGRHPRIRRREGEDFAQELARRRQEEGSGQDSRPREDSEEEASGALPPDRLEISTLEQHPDRQDEEEHEPGPTSGHLDVRV